MPVKINPIPYTQDELKEMFEYRDGELFWKKVHKRDNMNKIGDKVGNLVNKYLKVKLFYTYYSLARIIWKYFYGEPCCIIDHIDGNTLNNKIENLRDVSKIQNDRNKKCHRNGKIPCISNARRKTFGFEVKRRIGNKDYYLGVFNTLKEAEAALLKFDVNPYYRDSLIAENPSPQTVSKLAQNPSVE